MVVCFNCTAQTKAELDRLVATGHYVDHSQAIAAAIQNLAVIHSELADRSAVVVDPNRLTAAEEESASISLRAAPSVVQGSIDNPPVVRPVSLSSPIPVLFRRNPEIEQPTNVATLRVQAPPRGKTAAIDTWMFGQYNRLLPAKVTCRALINMFGDGTERQPLEKVATAIANEAAKLGQHLANIDEKRHLGRDDAMAVAFPKDPTEFKSIQRFATQFVASTNKEGELFGLGVSLNLIGRNPDYPEGIALTEAGWTFGMMENPLLDRPGTGTASEKFSSDEIAFLLDHIANAVPVEAFAYQTILSHVAHHVVTPDAVDEVLGKLPGHPKKILAQFVSTQRSGAICRMADLDLIARNRTGTRVSYVLTARGKDFLRSAKLDELEAKKTSRT